jgi:hypothetical protein
MHVDFQGDTIKVVAKKSDKQQGEWTTTGDIKVRFVTDIAAKSTYDQQRGYHINRDTRA